MSLRIYASNTIGVETITVESEKSTSKLNCIDAVCASGEELKRALQISGLPQYGTVMSFYGDMAKHVVGNWFN